jgi:hypothetical protein
VRELRVQCPDCGELDVPANEVLINQNGPGTLTYAFRCPQCRQVVKKRCDSQSGRLLLLGGAQADRATVDRLAAFRPDHVTQLRELLDKPDWFEDFLRAS